jgi:hypothetical protein
MRCILCYILVVLIPLPLPAGTAGVAILYAKGAAWVNGAAVQKVVAVFPGDLVTTASGVAAMTVLGSRVTITANSSVQYGVGEIRLDHGGLDISTYKAMDIHIGEIAIVPLSNARTTFQIGAGIERVEIVAEEGRVNVIDPSGTTTLSPGQHKTIDRPRKHRGATAAGHGSTLDSLPVAITGAAAISALGLWVWTRDSDAISKMKP